MVEVTKSDPLGWGVVAFLLRVGKPVILLGVCWYFVWWTVGLFAMSACQSPHPQPELGRTFHLIATVGRIGPTCNGYVKPWVGHTFHFVQFGALVLLAAVFAMAVLVAVARKIFGEKPEGPDLRA